MLVLVIREWGLDYILYHEAFHYNYLFYVINHIEILKATFCDFNIEIQNKWPKSSVFFLRSLCTKVWQKFCNILVICSQKSSYGCVGTETAVKWCLLAYCNNKKARGKERWLLTEECNTLRVCMKDKNTPTGHSGRSNWLVTKCYFPDLLLWLGARPQNLWF